MPIDETGLAMPMNLSTRCVETMSVAVGGYIFEDRQSATLGAGLPQRRRARRTPSKRQTADSNKIKFESFSTGPALQRQTNSKTSRHALSWPTSSKRWSSKLVDEAVKQQRFEDPAVEGKGADLKAKSLACGLRALSCQI